MDINDCKGVGNRIYKFFPVPVSLKVLNLSLLYRAFLISRDVKQPDAYLYLQNYHISIMQVWFLKKEE